jgi:hypothetical protein
MLTPSVSVVVPALNEARNIPHVFAKVPADYKVVLVDGYSVDGTVATARKLRSDVRVVVQTRQGKGNALACGFAAATGDIIAKVDADGEATEPPITLRPIPAAQMLYESPYSVLTGSKQRMIGRESGDTAVTIDFHGAADA